MDKINSEEFQLLTFVKVSATILKEENFAVKNKKGLNNTEFEKFFNLLEFKAWLSFKRICKNVLGNLLGSILRK